jgi:hypothetical protein
LLHADEALEITPPDDRDGLALVCLVDDERDFLGKGEERRNRRDRNVGLCCFTLNAVRSGADKVAAVIGVCPVSSSRGSLGFCVLETKLAELCGDLSLKIMPFGAGVARYAEMLAQNK